MNSLPPIVTRQRHDCDLNPGPSAPESSTLTTRYPHTILYNRPGDVSAKIARSHYPIRGSPAQLSPC